MTEAKQLHIFPGLSKQLVSLGCLEKLQILLDGGQVFGIVWQISQTWPWPYLWLGWTRSLVVLNLDFMALEDLGAKMARSNLNVSDWGKYPGYLLYACCFCFCATALLIAYILVNHFSLHLSRSFVVAVRHFTIFGLLFGYVPVGLAAIRLIKCNVGIDNDLYLAVDPSVKCTSMTYILSLTYCIGVFCVFSWYFPKFLHDMITINACTFPITETVGFCPSTVDYEIDLQATELKYLLDANQEWSDGVFWLHSAFSRKFVYLNLILFRLKIGLLVVFALGVFQEDGNPNNSGAEQMQAMLLWLVFFVFYAKIFIMKFDYIEYAAPLTTLFSKFARKKSSSSNSSEVTKRLTKLPYRNRSSNSLFLVVYTVLKIDVTLGMLSGIGLNRTNPMLLPNTQTIWLLAINGFGFLLVSLMMLREVVDVAKLLYTMYSSSKTARLDNFQLTEDRYIIDVKGLSSSLVELKSSGDAILLSRIWPSYLPLIACQTLMSTDSFSNLMKIICLSSYFYSTSSNESDGTVVTFKVGDVETRIFPMWYYVKLGKDCKDEPLGDRNEDKSLRVFPNEFFYVLMRMTRQNWKICKISGSIFEVILREILDNGFRLRYSDQVEY